MPARRIKSCVSCRVAKARCSLSAPCLRCAKRHLECCYTPIQSQTRATRRIEDLRPLRPALDIASGIDVLHSTTTVDLAPSVDGSSQEADTLSLMVVTTDIQVSDLNLYSKPFSPHTLDLPDSFYLTPAIAPVTQSSQNLNRVSTDPVILDVPSPSWSLNYDLSPSSDVLYVDHSMNEPGLFTTPNLTTLPTSEALKSQLSQRMRSLQQGSLTAKMVFSRLTEYTRMMADGKNLPPFIHPPCCLGQSDECPLGSPHQCLPETLAICANLTQMFYSSMPASSPFVWQQICTHLRQMKLEYEGYAEQKMLQAVQAAVIYGLLCSQHTELVSNDDAAWLLATIETFGLRLYSMCAWGLDVNHICSSRSEWILMESLRRIGCLLYLFNLLLQTDAQKSSSKECPGFINMPLPCVRELWQPISDRDWKKQYHEDVAARKQKERKGLTFRHLAILRQSPAYGEDMSRCSSSELAEELADWCERVDDLSMALWMALTVEGAGQAPEISKTYDSMY